MMATGPETQPSCAIPHASESTPEPITAVIMCALAVISVPTYVQQLVENQFVIYQCTYDYVMYVPVLF